MTSIVFVLALLQFPASVRASTSSECTVDSCDAFSMMQSRAHASLSAERSTLVGSSAKDKLASLMKTIEHEVVNLKVGDPLPAVVKDSLETIQTAIGVIQDKVETDLGNQSATLERFATAFQNCMTISTQTWPSIAAGANPLQQESDEVSNLKDLHAECRTKEVGDQMTNAVGQDGTCDIFLDAIQTLESIKPSGLKQTELSNFFEHFDETTFSQKATACDSAVKSYALTVEGCTANQTAYEKAVCHWHTSARLANNACEAIRSCRDVDGKLLEEECAAAQSRSIAWKAEEIAIKQIKCLLEKLFAGEYDKIKTCKDSIPEEGNEDYKITCPAVTTSSEEESKCSNLVKPADIAVVPGSDTWITTYSTEGWYNNSRTSADSDARITARELCELPPMSCPEGMVPNSYNTGCELTTTTTTTTQATTTTTTPTPTTTTETTTTQMSVRLIKGWRAACVLKVGPGTLHCAGYGQSNNFPAERNKDIDLVDMDWGYCTRNRNTKKMFCWERSCQSCTPMQEWVPQDYGPVEGFGVGSHQVCALDFAGKVTCWGNPNIKGPGNPHIPPSNLEPADQIDCYQELCCVRLKETQTLRCWGGRYANDMSDLEGVKIDRILDIGTHFQYGVGVVIAEDFDSKMKIGGFVRDVVGHYKFKDFAKNIEVDNGLACMGGTFWCVQPKDTKKVECGGLNRYEIMDKHPDVGEVTQMACGSEFVLFLKKNGEFVSLGWGIANALKDYAEVR